MTTIDLSGYWESEAGSTVYFFPQNSAGAIVGYFKQKNIENPALLLGFVSTTITNNNYPLGFTATWPKEGNDYASVTSYTGMYQSSSGKIRTVFLSVNPNAPGYSSVSVDTDWFTRITSKTEADFVNLHGKPSGELPNI